MFSFIRWSENTEGCSIHFSAKIVVMCWAEAKTKSVTLTFHLTICALNDSQT